MPELLMRRSCLHYISSHGAAGGVAGGSDGAVPSGRRSGAAGMDGAGRAERSRGSAELSGSVSSFAPEESIAAAVGSAGMSALAGAEPLRLGSRAGVSNGVDQILELRWCQ